MLRRLHRDRVVPDRGRRHPVRSCRSGVAIERRRARLRDPPAARGGSNADRAPLRLRLRRNRDRARSSASRRAASAPDSRGSSPDCARRSTDDGLGLRSPPRARRPALCRRGRPAVRRGRARGRGDARRRSPARRPRTAGVLVAGPGHPGRRRDSGRRDRRDRVPALVSRRTSASRRRRLRPRRRHRPARARRAADGHRRTRRLRQRSDRDVARRPAGQPLVRDAIGTGPHGADDLVGRSHRRDRRHVWRDWRSCGRSFEGFGTGNIRFTTVDAPPATEAGRARRQRARRMRRRRRG